MRMATTVKLHFLVYFFLIVLSVDELAWGYLIAHISVVEFVQFWSV
jgi:hypothetical protein